MKRSLLATGLAAAALLAAHPAHSQAELTEESVAAAFAAQDFQYAFGSCFVGMDKPEEVTLVVIIAGDGSATLSKVEPMMLAKTKTCISSATALLKFPATGGDYEITYPLAVPEVAGASTHPTTVAQPVVVTQPPPTVVYQDDSWKPIYSSGKRKIIAGAVTLGVGGVVFVMPGLLLMLYGQVFSEVSSTTAKIFTSAGVVLVGIGLVPVIVGIILISRGKALKARALRMRDGLAFDMPLIGIGPTPDGKGGQLGLTWTF